MELQASGAHMTRSLSAICAGMSVSVRTGLCGWLHIYVYLYCVCVCTPIGNKPSLGSEWTQGKRAAAASPLLGDWIQYPQIKQNLAFPSSHIRVFRTFRTTCAFCTALFILALLQNHRTTESQIHPVGKDL